MPETIPLSVIVPLAPGEDQWRALIDQLAALPTSSEIIVVHAGASPEDGDGLLSVANLRHLMSEAGRARQQNRGAAQARGRWLWFLHADSQLQPDTLPALQRFISRQQDALGYFDLQFADDGPRLARLNGWGANLRSRLWHMPFGDQGFVLPADCFCRLGGFDENARYGEDHLLVWAARRAGLPLLRTGAPLRTSARKYRRSGWLRTTARHGWLTLQQAWPQWRELRRQR